MPRAKPKWDAAAPGPAPVNEMPPALTKLITDAMAGESDATIQHMVDECQKAIAAYHTFARRKAEWPRYSELVAAAQKINTAARGLSEKLPIAGGLQRYLTPGLTARGIDDPGEFLARLASNLDTLAQAVEAEQATLQRLDDNGVKLRAPRNVLAEALATSYRHVTGKMPSACTEREHWQTHPYVMMLHATLEHCSGRFHSLGAVEHLARDAIIGCFRPTGAS